MIVAAAALAGCVGEPLEVTDTSSAALCAPPLEPWQADPACLGGAITWMPGNGTVYGVVQNHCAPSATMVLSPTLFHCSDLTVSVASAGGIPAHLVPVAEAPGQWAFALTLPPGLERGYCLHLSVLSSWSDPASAFGFQSTWNQVAGYPTSFASGCELYTPVP